MKRLFVLAITTGVLYFTACGEKKVKGKEEKLNDWANDPALQELRAFPGAEGAGSFAKGGRGGDVYVVKSLADDGQAGTLRYGLEKATGARTIVFHVSGEIRLTKTLNIKNTNLTIAGETAPAGGISIYGRTSIKEGCKDIIIRHIRFRSHSTTGDGDALAVMGHNIIIDHCSCSWSSDEVLSTGTSDTDKLTVQYCLIYEGLAVSYHVEEGVLQDHSMGSLLSSSVNGAVYSFHHNLYAHNRTRNPKLASGGPGMTLTLDFRNNVVYNWKSYAGYSTDEAENHPQLNYIGNYLVAGYNTESKSVNRAFDVQTANMKMYIEGNYTDPDKDNKENPKPVDDWNTLVTSASIPSFTKLAAPVDCPAVHTDDALTAYSKVMSKSGARYWERDAADVRVIKSVKNRTGRIIDWPKDADGIVAGSVYPGSNQDTGYAGYPKIASVSYPAGWDSDSDGMPDEWEKTYGLNPNDAQDRNGYSFSNVYTNLEVYLYSITKDK